MKIKTKELVGPTLDWAVAKCEGWDVADDFWITDPEEAGTGQPLSDFRPSTDWSQGGPIIECQHITLSWVVSNYLYVVGCWSAHIPQTNGKILYAPTPLIAAMRCYVASKLGDTIEVPEALR